MQRDRQLEILRELLRQLDEQVNIDAGVRYRNPVSSYTCPELAKREWNEFFKGHPQMIGLSGDLPGNAQQAAESGVIEYLQFGRNEPALHHYHNTFREALGMPPLERLEV